MIIAERFNGPAGSGHGGYSAGVFSRIVDINGPVEVTLRRPPPLDEPFTAVGTEIHAPGGDVVAEVTRVPPFQVAVPPVTYAEAEEASASYLGFTEHPFPRCYGCGPERSDGLRIFPGRLADGRTAAPFVFPAAHSPETVWAALDCPGGWTIVTTGRVSVLGRLAVEIAALPKEDDRCVIMGEAVSTQGRKTLVHTALYGPGEQVLATARSTWIAIDPPP